MADVVASDPFEIIGPVLRRVSTASRAAYDESLKRFSVHQRRVMAMDLYRMEINNGGHDQFYWNESGIVWRDALDGFDAAGMADLAAILKASASRFVALPSDHRGNRQAELTERQDEFGFDELDAAFFALETTTDLSASILAYIRVHADAFVFAEPEARLSKLSAWGKFKSLVARFRASR